MEQNDPVLAEMIRRIVEETDPLRIYLFGSRARGDAREDSDDDFLIVQDRPFGEGDRRYDQLTRAWLALRHQRCAQDLVLATADEFERWRGERCHLLGQVATEGRLIYERG